MRLQLHDSVSSPQDLKTLILDIREYARWFSHVATKQRVRAEKDVGKTDEPPSMSEAAVALLKGVSGDKPLTQESLDSLITALEDFEAQAPLIEVTLAAPPSGGLKKTLTAWFRKNIDPNVLVSFQFNSTLLGGMVVRYGSRIFDWSFRRQILAERGHFPEVLRRA